MSKAARKRRGKKPELDLGPERDPVRQQGRDSKHTYIREDWYDTAQRGDRSKAAARQRRYHKSYRTSSGSTWDHLFDVGAKIARKFESAGIDLGWGRVALY